MFSKYFAVFLLVSQVYGQSDYYRVCVPASQQSMCQSLDKDGSRVTCQSVTSRVDCALKLAAGQADLGVFSEEELLLLRQQQPSEHRVIARIQNVARDDAFAFESVAVVPTSFQGQLANLRGMKYCHPGLDQTELRWSPRVLRALEQKAARTDRCTEDQTLGKTAEEMEVDNLSQFFSAACRPGPWSVNTTIDARLKTMYPNLCSLCGDGTTSNCGGYSFDMGPSIAGASNDNRHIQALECLNRNGNGTVAYVAWQHVREYFTARAAQSATSFAILCEDGSLRTLTSEILANTSAPCAIVQQSWQAIVASSSRAAAVLPELQSWWPNGVSPGGNTWQSILFDVLVGGSALRAVFQTDLPTPAVYTSTRQLADIDATTSCMKERRWCVISTEEFSKCLWVRRAAYTLGLEPSISCQQRQNVFQCLEDIKQGTADFMSVDSNYGYLARQHYNLSPVKLLQNSRSNVNALSRIAALVKETSAQSEITRFENLRGKKACFPEFGGIAYVAFVRAAHERSVISSSECDYARAVGEFFDGACAPGAVDAAHDLGRQSSFNSTNLCTVCRPFASSANSSDFTCAFDYSNMYFGNNGSISCLTDTQSHVAFVEIQNINAHLQQLNLQANQFRVLCRNNTLASSTGVTVDDACLLALIVDSEVLTRRNDPHFDSLSSLLDQLDQYFGYNAATATQLINLEIFSAFNGTSDLLFKDTAIGLTEPSITTTHEPAKNYFELFSHLEACTGSGVVLGSSLVMYFLSFGVLRLFGKMLV